MPKNGPQKSQSIADKRQNNYERRLAHANAALGAYPIFDIPLEVTNAGLFWLSAAMLMTSAYAGQGQFSAEFSNEPGSSGTVSESETVAVVAPSQPNSGTLKTASVSPKTVSVPASQQTATKKSGSATAQSTTPATARKVYQKKKNKKSEPVSSFKLLDQYNAAVMGQRYTSAKDIIEELIERGENLNTLEMPDGRRKFKSFVIHVAIEKGNLDFIEYLVGRGADINIPINIFDGTKESSLNSLIRALQLRYSADDMRRLFKLGGSLDDIELGAIESMIDQIYSVSYNKAKNSKAIFIDEKSLKQRAGEVKRVLRENHRVSNKGFKVGEPLQTLEIEKSLKDITKKTLSPKKKQNILDSFIANIKKNNIKAAKSNIDELIDYGERLNKITFENKSDDHTVQSGLIDVALVSKNLELIQYLCERGIDINSPRVVTTVDGNRMERPSLSSVIDYQYSADELRKLFELGLRVDFSLDDISKIFSYIDRTYKLSTVKATELKDVIRQYWYIHKKINGEVNVFANLMAMGKSVYHAIDDKTGDLFVSVFGGRNGVLDIVKVKWEFRANLVLIGDLEVFSEWVGRKKSVRFSDKDGNTFLHYIAGRGTPEFAQKLIDLGGDINRSNIFGMQPVHMAIIAGNVRLVEFYLDKNVEFISPVSKKLSKVIVSAVSSNPQMMKLLHERHIDFNAWYLPRVGDGEMDVSAPAHSTLDSLSPSYSDEHYTLWGLGVAGITTAIYTFADRESSWQKTLKSLCEAINAYFKESISNLSCELVGNRMVIELIENKDGYIRCCSNESFVDIKSLDILSELKKIFTANKVLEVLVDPDILILTSDINANHEDINPEQYIAEIKEFVDKKYKAEESRKTTEEKQERERFENFKAIIEDPKKFSSLFKLVCQPEKEDKAEDKRQNTRVIISFSNDAPAEKEIKSEMPPSLITLTRNEYLEIVWDTIYDGTSANVLTKTGDTIVISDFTKFLAPTNAVIFESKLNKKIKEKQAEKWQKDTDEQLSLILGKEVINRNRQYGNLKDTDPTCRPRNFSDVSMPPVESMRLHAFFPAAFSGTSNHSSSTPSSVRSMELASKTSSERHEDSKEEAPAVVITRSPQIEVVFVGNIKSSEEIAKQNALNRLANIICEALSNLCDANLTSDDSVELKAELFSSTYDITQILQAAREFGILVPDRELDKTDFINGIFNNGSARFVRNSIMHGGTEAADIQKVSGFIEKIKTAIPNILTYLSQRGAELNRAVDSTILRKLTSRATSSSPFVGVPIITINEDEFLAYAESRSDEKHTGGVVMSDLLPLIEAFMTRAGDDLSDKNSKYRRAIIVLLGICKEKQVKITQEGGFLAEGLEEFLRSCEPARSEVGKLAQPSVTNDSLTLLIQQAQKILGKPEFLINTALALPRLNPRVAELNYANKFINDLDVSRLIQLINRNPTITHINLSNNQITEVGAQQLLDMLRTNPQVQLLNLAGNSQISVATLTQINRELAKPPYIRDTALPFPVPISDCKELDYSNQDLTDAHITNLIHSLKFNRTIAKINLSNNKISRAGAQELLGLVLIKGDIVELNTDGNADFPASTRESIEAELTRHREEAGNDGSRSSTTPRAVL